MVFYYWLCLFCYAPHGYEPDDICPDCRWKIVTPKVFYSTG